MRRLEAIRSKFTLPHTIKKSFSSMSLFNGNYTFMTPINSSSTQMEAEQDQFIDYFVDKYNDKARTDEYFIYDNFIKDSNYVVQKYKYPFSLRDSEMKSIRNFPFQDQVNFFIGFLKLSQECMNINQQFIKDFRMYFLLSKHEKLAELFTDPYLDLQFRTQDLNLFLYRYKRSFVGLLKIVNDLYPISIYNLVHLMCFYRLVSMLKENTDDMEITYLVESSLTNFWKKLNLSNQHETFTLIRFINLMYDNFPSKVNDNKNFLQLLNVLDNFYLSMSSAESFKSLIESEKYPETLIVSHILKSAFILNQNKFENGHKIIQSCMDILAKMNFDRVPIINVKALAHSLLNLEPSEVNREVISKILLSEQVVAFYFLDKSTERLFSDLANKFDVKPYAIDGMSKIELSIPLLFEKNQDEDILSSVYKSFQHSKGFLEATSKNSYYGKSYVVFLRSLTDQIFRNLTPEVLAKKDVSVETLNDIIEMSRELMKYMGVSESLVLMKNWIDLLSSRSVSDFQAETNKAIIDMLDDFSNSINVNPCYLSQFLNAASISVIYNKNGYINSNETISMFNNFCIDYVKLLCSKISSFSELKNAMKLFTIVLNFRNKPSIENELKVVIEKAQVVITHMKTKNKASLNFIIMNIGFVNMALKTYPSLFNATSNLQLFENLDFCIKTVIENKAVELSSKIDLFNNTIYLYDNLLEKKTCKYLFETQVLQPLIKLMEASAVDTKLDNIMQHTFNFGKHPTYSMCTRLMKFISIFDAHLTDDQKKVVFNIFLRAVPFIKPNEVLENLEILTQYDEAVVSIELLLEQLFGRHEIYSSLKESKSVDLKVFYNTDDKRIDIEKFLDYMILHDVKIKNTKMGLGLAIYLYEELANNMISLTVISKFYRQLEHLSDINLIFFDTAVKNYLLTINPSSFTFFDIAHIPLNSLPENFMKIVVEGQNFGLTHWSPQALISLITYMSRNNVYIPNFISLLIDNLDIIINSDVNVALLAKLNVPTSQLGNYCQLMKKLISQNKIAKEEISDVLFTYFVNLDYSSEGEYKQELAPYKEFFTRLADDLIVKEDLFGLIQYNPKLNAFCYNSFDKVLGLTVTDSGTPDTIRGNFDTPTQFNVNVDEAISLKAELLVYESFKLNLEVYKRYFFWSRFHMRFMAIHKYPLEYNNIYFKKFERYMNNMFSNFNRLIKNMHVYKSKTESGLELRTYQSAENIYAVVPVELKFNVAGKNGVSRDLTNVCKFLVMNASKTLKEGSPKLDVVSIDEIERDPGLIDRLQLIRMAGQEIEDENYENDADIPDLIKPEPIGEKI